MRPQFLSQFLPRTFDRKIKVVELLITFGAGVGLISTAIFTYWQFRQGNEQLRLQVDELVRTNRRAEESDIERQYEHALEMLLDQRAVAQVTAILTLTSLAKREVAQDGLKQHPFFHRVLEAFTANLRQPISTASDLERSTRRLIINNLLSLVAWGRNNKELPGTIDLTRIDLSGVELDGLAFNDVDLRAAVLSKASFRNATLTKVKLVEAQLDETDFRFARFATVDLSSVKKAKNVSFTFTVMEDVNFHDAHLDDADFTGSTLRNIVLVEAELNNPVLLCSIENATASSAHIISPRLGTGPFTNIRGYGVRVRKEDLAEFRARIPESQDLIYYTAK